VTESIKKKKKNKTRGPGGAQQAHLRREGLAHLCGCDASPKCIRGERREVERKPRGRSTQKLGSGNSLWDRVSKTTPRPSFRATHVTVETF
jgi:hypothetical protein